MTIKAYRRNKTGPAPKVHNRPAPRRTGAFWGVTWQTDDFDDADWDALPARRNVRR